MYLNLIGKLDVQHLKNCTLNNLNYLNKECSKESNGYGLFTNLCSTDMGTICSTTRYVAR